MGIPDNWRITPRIDGDNCIGSGELFVDHSQNHRTGHLGHALVNCSGEIMAFYTNCSGLRDEGHNGFGWVEYKRSVDGGKTWGPPIIMEHTYKTLLDGLYTCQRKRQYIRIAVQPFFFTLILLLQGNIGNLFMNRRTKEVLTMGGHGKKPSSFVILEDGFLMFYIKKE